VKRFISSILDASVVPGFSKIGYAVRSRLNNWDDVSSYDLTGHVVVITGPTSGLGKETARILAPTGVQLVLVARNADKLAGVINEITPSCTGPAPVAVVAEMGNLRDVAKAAQQIVSQFPFIHALVHNAGALLSGYEVSAQGYEQTVASHVLGPHLLTRMCLPALRAVHGRVITVSSGGMYSMELPKVVGTRTLEMHPDAFDGTKQYAIAKRAQVTLNEMWAQREPEVEFAAMHPGWADTPGVRDSLPGFQKLTQPILRSAREGADTIAWLCGVRVIPGQNGSFWSDREIRSIHKLPNTRRKDTEETREFLWKWCDEATGPFTDV
jgi:NAD(P)-dependent dehydrogenase (short-subunit alcohol dehydrogenase family)